MTDHQPSPPAQVRRDLVDGRIWTGSRVSGVPRLSEDDMRSGGVPTMALINDEIARCVDAQAPGLGSADLVFVFGSTLPDAMLPAAELLETQLARTVVLTGGPNRRTPEHVESEEHARLLLARGVTSDRMIIERGSRTSVENVAFARPLIEERLGPVRTVIAVVKWWQRRQLHVLAAGMPSVERIYAVTWNPPARTDGRCYDRTTWAFSSDRERIEREYAYLGDLLHRGELPPLIADGHGWTPG